MTAVANCKKWEMNDSDLEEDLSGLPPSAPSSAYDGRVGKQTRHSPIAPRARKISKIEFEKLKEVVSPTKKGKSNALAANVKVDNGDDGVDMLCATIRKSNIRSVRGASPLQSGLLGLR